MHGKIKKIHTLFLIIGTVGFSATVEGGVLPPFIENNQSKEELVTTENLLTFATNLHAEQGKNFSVEYKRTKKYREASEKAYIQTLESLVLLEDRQKLETHFRVLLEYSDTRDVKFLAMKSLLIAGILEEESLRAIERVVTHKNIPKDLIYLIFMERHMIIGERPVNLPLAGKQKYFDFLVEDISSGKRDGRGNAYDFIRIGKEIINERSADDTGKIVADMARVYSKMPRETQRMLGYDFIGIAREEKVKRKYDHLIVDEILRVASGIKQDEDFRVKIMVLSDLTLMALEEGFSEKSIHSIKSMLFKSEDEEISGLLIRALYKVDDDDIQEKAYSMLKESNSFRAKIGVCQYFRERKDPSVISTYIEMLKSVDAKKMMSKNEDGSLYWKKSSESITMVIHINEFRGVTTLDDDFEGTRKDILEWWDKNSSDEKFYWKAAFSKEKKVKGS